jgi:hypothetical protein
MCTNEELKEMITTFKQLPDLYQKSIMAIVKDRKQLYELQLNIKNVQNSTRR